LCHKRDLNAGKHINPKLQHAWNCYGEKSFILEIVEDVPPNPKILFERENHYLSTLKPHVRGVGYNICPTAQGGDNFTHNPRKEKTRQLLRELAQGENNGMYGKKHTKKAIRKQKKSAGGRYTLDWFIERYGDRPGRAKFEDRRRMLMNRPKACFSHKESPTMSFKGKKHKKTLGGKQRRTREYFRDHWDDFVKMVKSGNYSQRQLSIMLGISRPTIIGKVREVLGQ
jgi:group I intron endonuclease